jgi:hypothetical protein
MARNVPQQMQPGGARSLPVQGGNGNWAKGYAPQLLQFPNLDPQQQQLIMGLIPYIQQLMQQPQANLNQGNGAFDVGQYKFDFNPIAQEARTNFAQQTIPSIAERFSGLGAQKSSAFGQQLGAAGAVLESGLASLGAQYGLQNRGQEADIALRNRGQEAGLALQNQGQLRQYIMSLLGQATQPLYENAYVPRQAGFFENLGVGAGKAAGQAAGTALKFL